MSALEVSAPGRVEVVAVRVETEGSGVPILGEGLSTELNCARRPRRRGDNDPIFFCPGPAREIEAVPVDENRRRHYFKIARLLPHEYTSSSDFTMADELQVMVASRKRIVIEHPGAHGVGGDLYAGPERTEIDLVERQTYRGRSKYNANSLLFDGGSSTFVVSPGVILSQLYLNATIFVPTNTRVTQFWLLNAIKTIKVQIPGSSGFGDLSISGQAHFMAVMAMTKSEEKRRALAEACPRYHNQSAGHIIGASVPLILPWSTPELTGSYGMDTKVFNTPLNVTIEFESSWKVMSGFDATPVTLPIAFTNLYIRASETDILDTRADIGRKLRANPSLSYGLPFLALQSAVEPIANVIPGIEFQTTLNALPSGMVQCMLLTMVPDIWTGSAAGSASGDSFVHPFSVDFQSLRVERDGRVIYQFDTRLEGDLQQTLQETGGNGKAFYVLDSQSPLQETVYATSPVTAAGYDAFNVPVSWRHRVYVIPLANQIDEVLTEKRHEHTPLMAGVNLQIFGNIAGTQFQETLHPDVSRKSLAQDPLSANQDSVQLRNPGLKPAAGITYPAGNAGSAQPEVSVVPANYRLHICYVRNAILDTQGQSTELIT
jgi:hypothetical protein